MSTEKSPLLHRLEITALLIAIIAAPVSTVVFFVTQQAERDKLRVERDKLVIERDKLKTDTNRLDLEYVRLAIGVLQPTEKIEQPQIELRGWAVEILQDSAPIKLSNDAAKALKYGEANLTSGTSGWTSWDTDYTTHSYSTSPTINRKNTNPSTPTPGQTPSPKPTHQ